MATIYIDNKPYEVEDGQNLLNACLSLGFNVPYFCWHPALGSVGACRLCAVKQFRDENDTRGRLVMSCMTPATDGTRISIDDPEAREFRAHVIEWLMENHPHDCPVCDEGGECHLQDMTVMTGHAYREYRFPKRTHRNQDLGPFVNHEMNRCIQCYRCVRYYRNYAGGRDLNVFAAHDHVYFGRYEDGVLESEFSGNLVEVCPTGVFTDKTLKKHYTRKWDLQTAPSVCVHCGVGCNTIPGERYGQLRRVVNRYNGQVNGYFLCDRGRYGYEFVNSERRIRAATVAGAAARAPGNGSGPAEPPGREGALERAAGLVKNGARVIGIGSPRASLEANFALRTLVAPERFYLGVSEPEYRLVAKILDILQNGPARTPSQREMQACDVVLVLGEDLTNTAPMLALALRQSVRQQPMKLAHKIKVPEWDDASVRGVVQDAKGPLFIATLAGTRLDDVATGTYHAAPDDLARLGYAVARELDAGAPEPGDLPEAVRELARTIAEALRGAARPLVVSGTSYGSEALIEAAAAVAWALAADGRPAALSYVVPECNTLGLGMIGGGSLEAAFAAVRDGTADTVVVLENDLFRRADAAAVDALLSAARHVIVLDHLASDTTARAEVVLPAATFAEGDGTLVNHEGRAQRFYQVFVPGDEIQESWRWLRDVMLAAGRSEAAGWRNLDDVAAAMAAALPAFKPVLDVAPPAGFRIAGMKIPRQPHRYSGRTAMRAHVDVSEPKPPEDPDSPLGFTMEGYQAVPPRTPPPALIARYWAPGWNSGQALNKYQSEAGGPLRGGDPGQRLIEPGQAGETPHAGEAPPAFTPREGEWLAVPAHHIFGSEELSILTPGVAGLAPRPYVALNPEDAAALGVSDGQELALATGGAPHRVRVKLTAALPRGAAGLPAGLPDLLGVALPAWVRLAP